MKRKFTFLIAAAVMLLTMMATTGTMWGQTRDTQTVSYGWETTDNATPWTISDAIVATSGEGNTGSYAGKINTNSTTVQFNEKVYVTSFSYAFKRTSNNNNYSVYIETSTDGSTWSIKDTQAMNTFTNGSYRTVTKEFDGSQELYVRFRCNNTTAVRYVDDVTITYATGASQLDPCDLTLTNASTSLVFDLYNNSDAQVINYTTSSTGVVSVAENDYIETDVDQVNKTITVTPAAVTNGAKVITVNQAADDNYAAGSKTFTINITDSTPFSGGNVTFDATTDTGTSPLVKNGVTFACTNGVLNNGSEYRLYKNSVTTFSVTQGNITQIAFTGTSSNPASGFGSQTGWTTNGDNGTWTGEATEVSFTASGAQVRATQIIVTVESSSDPAVHTTTTINVPVNFNTDIQQGTNAGTLTATVTVTSDGSEVSGATVTWESSNTSVATIDANGAVTLVAVGTTTITASYAGVEDQYKPSEGTYPLTVSDSNAPGTENNPYTVAAAMAATPASGTSNYVYIHGIVSAFYNTSIVGDGNNYRYYISDDGTTTSQLLVYKGKGLNNEAFSTADDLHIGDIVTIYGGLTMYQSAPEIASGNYLTYWERPAVDVEAPAFSVPAGGYAETQTVAITCATENAQIYYTNDGTDPTNESFLYDEEIDIEETTTIKAIAYVGENASTVSTAAYYILSDDNTYTVDEALAFETYPQNNIFVEGIVSTAPTSLISGGLLTYYISADGTTTNQLQVYKGKNLGNTAFTDAGEIVAGERVTIFGNVKIYNNTKEFDQGNYLVTFEAYQMPVINANNINIACDATSGTINYTIEPYVAGTMTAETEADWISNFNTNTFGQVSFTTTANDTEEARVATVTLTYQDISETIVNKVVTVTQAPHVNDYAELPLWFNGIRDDIDTTAGLTQDGLGEDFISSTGLFLNFDDEGDWVVLKTNEAPGRVSFTISNQGFSGGTFKVQTSADGETYSDLAVYTSIDDQHYDTYYNFDENVRYIKWIYTTNGNGSVGLGTISVAKFVSPIRVITAVAPQYEIDTLEFSSAQAFGSLWLYLDHLYVESTDQFSVAFCHADGSLLESNEEAPDWLFTTGEYYSFDHPSSESSKCSYSYNIDANTSYEPREAYLRFKCVIDETSYYSLPVTVTQAGYVPAIVTVNPDVVEVTAEGGDGSLEVAYENFTPTFAYTIYFCDANGEEATYDWIQAEMTDEYNIHYEIDANDGEARTAYFKVDAYTHSIYSNLVTINQAEYVVDYATLPFEFDGGRADIANTNGLTQDGLDSDYGSSPKLKFNGTGDWVILKINETPGVLSFDIKGNSFSGSTFTVQTSEDGITYTDLETYTELGDTQNESFDNLGENVRYIKWIYTEKVNGNVGLGNIALAKYVEPVASITVTPAIVDVTAEGENDGILPIAYQYLTITEASDFDIQYYDANNQPLSKDDEPDWMGAAVQDNATQDGYEVSYFVSENDGEARTAYFKVYALDANMELVYSNLITVSQEAYVAPTATIAVTPETVNVEASGEDEGSLAIAYENLTITDAGDFDIQYYDANNQPLEKEQEPDWMAAAVQANTTQDGYEVSYYIDPNEGAARTAYFKVYALDDNTEIVYSNLVTINQAAFVVDYATLPFEWEGGPRSEFEALNGTSTYGVGDYGDNQGVYRMKLDGTGDYIQVKTNELPGIVTIGVKMIGGATTSTLTVQGSTDGTTFTNVEALTISGSQNDELTLSTTNDFAATDRYVRLLFTKGSNVGVGPITIAQVDLTPSITVAPATLNLNCDGGDGELTVTHKNLADDPQLNVIFVESDGETTTTYDWIQASINAAGNVAGHINTNTGEARTAYLKVTGRDADNNLIKSNLVTFNQAAYTEPSIVFETTTLDIVAGGENRTMSFDYEGLGQNPTFSINFYESDGTTPATYSWIEAEITQDDKVNISVTANEGAARSAYFKVSGVNGEVNALSNLVTINQAAYTQLATYSLVTSVDDIVSGKHYIIASSAADGAAYAMGNQNGNNRKGYAVTVANEQITEAEGVYEFVINTHETSSKDVVYTIYDAVTPGYLYASSSSANQLKTTTTLNDNGKWAIEISSTGAATITAQGSNSRKLMRYNPNNNSPIFACYATNTNIGNAPCLYVKDNDNNYEYYGMEISYEGISIPNGETITVGAGSVMTVPNNFGNDNPAALVIKDGGQLIHESDVEATVQKRVSGYTYKSGDGWYFIASPVNGLSTDSVATGTYDLFIYNEPNAYWYSSTGTTAPFTTLERGVGYLYANTSDINLDFAGLMIKTNQNIEMNLSYTEAMGNLKGFNLMGNPFTRNLGTDDMKLGGADVASYYGFDNKGEEIVVRYIDADPIKPGQGFMVQATAANQKLVFNPGAKAESENNGYISIVAGNENGTDNAFIHFGNVNTLRKMTFSGDKSQVYVMNNGDDYAAARLDEAKGLVPVHFEAAGEGIYTITIEAKNLDLETLRLIDNFTGEEIDLLVEPTYTFKANSDEPANRFTLLFEKSTLSIDENDAENEVFAYQSGDEIYFNGEGTLQVFDVMGRFVMSREINGNDHISTSLFNTGVYVFRLVGETVMTQKIVVR